MTALITRDAGHAMGDLARAVLARRQPYASMRVATALIGLGHAHVVAVRVAMSPVPKLSRRPPPGASSGPGKVLEGGG